VLRSQVYPKEVRVYRKAIKRPNSPAPDAALHF
jgi:hypothetical protein